MIDHAKRPILVVDDYQAMRLMMRTLLRQIGFSNIDQAEDGARGLAKLRDGGYGLVISDLKMEPMSGLMLLREVRQDHQLRRIPFIMVTAASDAEEVIAAKEAGVSDYIVKPFTLATLRAKIGGLIELPVQGPVWVAAS